MSVYLLFFAVTTAFILYRLNLVLSPFEDVSHMSRGVPSNCEFIDLAGISPQGGAEDMEVITSKFTILSNMPYKMFHFSNNSCPLAAQYPLGLFDIETRTATILTLDGFPSSRELKPHGISFDKGSDTLAVVSHAVGEGESRVELFRLHYYVRGDETSSKEEADGIRAEYVGSSAGFPATCTINDVVLTSADTMFVTEWMKDGVPSDPHEMESRSPLGKLKQDLMHISGVSVYNLHKCTSPGTDAAADSKQTWTCQVVKTLPSMNGIATTSDRSMLAVVMISMKGINFYRLPHLTLAVKVQLPIIVDNLVLSESESGRVPYNDPNSGVDAADGAPGETVDVWYGGGIVRGMDYLSHIRAVHDHGGADDGKGGGSIPSAVVRVVYNRDTNVVTHRIVAEAAEAGCWSVAARLPGKENDGNKLKGPLAIGSFCQKGMYLCN